MPSHQGTAAQPHLGFHQQMGKPFAPQATLSETDLVDIALAVQFPPAQQPFLMFLQAADSHRLNTSLARQDCAPCVGTCVKGTQRVTSAMVPRDVFSSVGLCRSHRLSLFFGFGS